MRNNTVLWVLLAFTLGFILPVCSCIGMTWVVLSSMGAMIDTPAISQAGGDAIGVIDLSGTIGSDDSGSLTSSMITPGKVSALLDQAAELENVKAVLVKVNSPGGSVVASDEIYHLLLDFEKPVVIWMGETAASGGYYISCGSDYVFAHPDTLTGSIGVISQFVNAEELLDKVGVEVFVIASGPHKDMGAMFREMTEEERQIWSEVTAQVYADFVQVVAESRGLSEETVRQLADGRVYTGRQALEQDLIDAVGLFSDAVTKAAELGGIEGEPQIIELKSTPSFLEVFSGIQGRTAGPTWLDLLNWAGVPSVNYRFVAP